MASRDIKDLHPVLQPIAIQHQADYAETPSGKLGYKIVVDATYRSNDEQNADFFKGRYSNGQVMNKNLVITWARGGQSAHNCTMPGGSPGARAYDIAIVNPDGKTCDWSKDPTDQPWKDAHDLGRSYLNADGKPALILGVDWPEQVRDGPHFELAFWKTSIYDVPTN